MRIAHVVRRYVRSEWGGTETVVWHAVREQCRLGHEARVFCTAALGGEGFPYWYPYFPMPASDRLALDKKGGSPFSPALFRAVADWRPDVIHIHAGGRLATAAVRLAERLRVPSLLSLHGGAAVVPEEEIRQMLRPLRGKIPYGGILDRLLGLRFDPISRADAVLAISRGEVSRLRQLHPKRRIEYFPNGVDAESAAEPVRVKAEGDFRRLLCVSRIDYQKNQLALVDLLASQPQCRLTLVGPVTSARYADLVLSRAKELGVAERFTLIPGLPPDSHELAACFAAADAFVLPSVHEPFGIVALEAMRAGLPLLAANVGGLPDFVKDGENGLLFDPRSSESLVAAWRRLTPELAGRLVAGGRATVAEYAWPKIVARLLALYAELREGVRP